MPCKKDHKQIVSYGELINQCALTLYKRYDDIFAIDLKADAYKLVLHTENKYLTPKLAGKFSEMVAGVATEQVYIHDRKNFLKIFNMQYLEEKFRRQKEDIDIEFRLINSDKTFRWVQVTILPLDGFKDEIAICYVLDINARKEREERESEYLQKKMEFSKRVFKSIGAVYSEVMEVDLEIRKLISIKSNLMPHKEGGVFDYFKAFKLFLDKLTDENDKRIVREEFSVTALKSFIESGQRSRAIEVKIFVDETAYEWIELSVFSILDDDLCHKMVLVTIRNINEQKLLKGIVDKFVYENCDYFIYLDAKSDSYVMFSSSESGTPLPAIVCESYSAENIKHAELYVAAEDKSRIIREMELTNVLARLDESGEYNIYCGVIDPKLGYTRKRMQYRYYDKENQMILMTRTDITSIYNEEKKKHDMLRQALKEASTDSLTGLYNQKAVRRLVNERLTNKSRGVLSACLFIDIDNFKQVNDCFGHQKGDELLQYAANALIKISFPSGLTGRVGGDEFVVFLDNLIDEDDVGKYAAKICSVFNHLTDNEFNNIHLSCSVGIALFPRDGENYNTLAQKADQALYYAKSKGKNRYSFYKQEVAAVSCLSMISSIDKRVE